MRRFELVRARDKSGVSGIGIVAQGVEFDDGVVALHWLTPAGSDERYSSALALIAKHGHGGDTVIMWHDEPLAELIARKKRERG